MSTSTTGEFELLYKDEVNIEDTYLSFSVGSEEYAIGVQFVTEIVRLQKIIKVPNLPNYIKGIINLRGKVLPVMDIRSRFGMEELEYSDRTVIAILEKNNILTGIAVDGVDDVVEISSSNIEDPPNHLGFQSDINVVKGIGKVGDNVWIILDLNNLISLEKINFDPSVLLN